MRGLHSPRDSAHLTGSFAKNDSKLGWESATSGYRLTIAIQELECNSLIRMFLSFGFRGGTTVISVPVWKSFHFVSIASAASHAPGRPAIACSGGSSHGL